MALALVASAVNTNDATGTTLSASTTLNILAGDLIVAFGGLAVSSGAVTIATVTGGTALTMTQGNYNYYSVFEYMGWKQFSANESSATFRMTTSSDAANRSILVTQWRDDVDSTIDIHSGFVPGNDTGTAMASAALDVIGDDLLAIAYAMVGNAATFSALNIDGVTADGTISAGSRVRAWYRLLSASDTGIAATGSLASSDEYIVELFTFRAVPKGSTLSSVRVQTTTDDWLHIESAPTGGALITMWGRVPAYTGGYPHQRGNATLLEAQGDDVAILGLICNGGADAANVGVQRYNNNVMVGSRTPRDGWAGDYCMIDKYDLRIPEENMLGGWNFYAVQYILQGSAVLIRQWSKAGRGAEILHVESNPTFAELRAFLVSQGWTSGDAAMFTPDDLVRIILGAYPGDSANFVYYDMTQIRVYARSTDPTLAEIDAISLAYAPDTTAWADWKLEWTGGAAVLTDRSGNGRTLLLNGSGTLYQGADFFDGNSGMGAQSIVSDSSVGQPAITQVHVLTANDISSASSVTMPYLGGRIYQTVKIFNGRKITLPKIGYKYIGIGISGKAGLGVYNYIAGEYLSAGSSTDSLSADSIASASSVGQPIIGQIHLLTANSIASASSVDQPIIYQVHLLTATGVSSASSVGQPIIHQVHVLTATGVSSASSVGQPIIHQVHVLTANAIASASSVDQPIIYQVHLLTADSIASASEVGQPVITQTGSVVNLLADDIASASDVGQPIIHQVHILTATGVSSASSVGQPVMVVIRNLLADGIYSDSTVGQPAIGQEHILFADDISSDCTVGRPVLSTVSTGALGAVNVGGTWYTCTDCSIVINGTWRTVTEIQESIGESWKAVTN
jgi:hypothetical protein